MTYDIEKYTNEPAEPERYPQPAWYTPPGQLDRRNEGNHIVHMRQVRRDIEAGVAEEGKKLLINLARFERLGRQNTEAKFRLHRAEKETQLLGEDNIELLAKFRVLDDELLRRLRIELLDEDE